MAYEAEVKGIGSHSNVTTGGADRHQAHLAAEGHASHMLRHNPELVGVSILITRVCDTCGGTGAVTKGKRVRRKVPCSACHGLEGSVFVGLRIAERDQAWTLAPCTGACCDGIEREVCSACLATKVVGKACENPICRGHATAMVPA